MSDIGFSFRKPGIPNRQIWRENDGDSLDALLRQYSKHPFFRARHPAGNLAHIIDAKRARRAADESDMEAAERAGEMADELQQAWGRVAVIIIVGLIIAIIGGAIHLARSGPIPPAIGAFGMLLVVAALWHGGKLQNKSSR